MLRLIGILIGSALAVALLLIAVGVPQFEPQPEEPVIAPQPVGGPSGTIASEAAHATPNPVVTPKPVTGPSDPIANEAEHMNETEALIEEVFAPEPEPVASAPSETPAPTVEENWYAFWSPFRSEIAANGFINKLQATTGIDYRVVKIKTGVYEVAFAYVDDADIQNKLARISSATGLDMTGS